MVHDFERGDPETLQTMRLVMPENSTPELELDKWRQRACEERANLRPVVQVSHELESAPEPASFAEFERIAAAASPELVDLYKHHDGIHLFVDEECAELGLYFYSIAAMKAEKDGLAPWLEMMAEDQYEEEEYQGRLEIFGIPDWLETAIVFGGIGVAAERLIIPLNGNHTGHVFMFCHDPLGFRHVASSFGSFLENIRNDPCKAVDELDLDYLYDAEHYRVDA